MSSHVYLTVVIPVLNEEAFIGSTLNSLIEQDYPKDRYELLIIDGMSSDDTRGVVERFIAEHPGIMVRLLLNPGRLSSCARNIGIRAAQGRLVAVIDGHVFLPHRRLFVTLERLREKHGALCFARPAPLLVPGLDSGMPLWIALARKSWLAHSRRSHIYGDVEGYIDPTSSGFAYDRSVFEQIGYFDESFDAAEDVEFHHRLKKAGIQAYSSPDLTIFSYPRSTLKALFRQMTRYGDGRAHLIRKHPDAFTKEALVPAGVFLFFTALPIAALSAVWSVPIALAYTAVFVLYLLLALGTGFTSSWHIGRVAPGVLVAFAICVTHLGLGFGLCRTILRRGKQGQVLSLSITH